MTDASPVEVVRGLVERYGHGSLADYARSELAVGHAPDGDTARGARTILVDGLARAAHAQLGASRAEVEAAFDRLPVLSTGLHASLLLGAPSFAEHCVMLVAARAAGSPLLFTKATCRVSLITWSGYGPGYVQCAGGAVRVFDLSRKIMKRSCAHSRLASPRLAFQGDAATPIERAALDAVTNTVGDLSAGRVCTAFTASNQRLARSWVRPGEPRTVFVDHLPNEVLAQHLRGGSAASAVARIVLDPDARGRFYGAYQRHRRRYEPGFEHGTSMFWHLPDGRLRALRINGTTLVGEAKGWPYEYPLDATSLANALERGDLLPDIPLTFLALSVLPRVRVAGGPNQLGYTSAVAAAFAQVCEQLHGSGFDRSGARAPVSSAWVVGVVSPFFRVLDLLASTDDPALMSATADRWSALPVRETVGDLRRMLTTAGLLP